MTELARKIDAFSKSLMTKISGLSSIEQLLRSRQSCNEFPINSISNIELGSVPAWHRLDLSKAIGWKYFWGGKESFRLDLSEPLVVTENHIQTVYLSSIYGLSASKSTLANFKSTTELIKQPKCDYLINDLSFQALHEALEWWEIRLLNRPNGGGDRLFYFAYFNKWFYVNSGGSHHFCAAKYIAEMIETDVPITCNVVIHRINERTVNHLKSRYRAVLLQLTEQDSYGLKSLLIDKRIEFISHSINQTGWIHNWQIYFFPIASKKSNLVYELFIKHKSIDFFEMMQKLINNQFLDIN